MIPFFILFSAYAISHIIQKLKKPDYKTWVLSTLSVLIFIGFLTNSSFFGVRDINHQREHYLTGYALAQQGNYRQAIKELKQSLKYPDDPLILTLVYSIMGDIYCTQRQYTEGEKAYLAALRINPQYAKAYYKLGNLYMILGYLDRAEYAYRQAIKLYPDYFEAKRNLGILLQSKK